MEARSKFWESYLCLVGEIKANIQKPNVENAFRDLVRKIFTNFNNLFTKFPLKYQFKFIDLLRYNSDFENFLKDFYIIYGNYLPSVINDGKEYKNYDEFRNEYISTFLNFEDTDLYLKMIRKELRGFDCEGDGQCLTQKEDCSYSYNGCCHPVKCKTCNLKLPQWVLNCHKSMCMNCAIEEFSREKNID